ncbi:outer membrane biogenesis protein BamB [Caulifigura coniformis]|uniref:Outer membrane biogenesis protein BamB n=1 Tax=Caulifigura coniformis TaxID=2527983 RepID=A0A517SFA6_9PLAN|nr:PQQ-binding-like beta-propeller repeat protein [Caulifigura coniformis]QDT54825.1 outer membrane biogenesis protein BamB [Caulifigura coniformis]
MPFLEIVHLNGEVERRPLEKQQPVTVGSHSSNDIRINEEGVETLHCRISWNKRAFEAVAAGIEGFEVNGSVVQKAVLKQGDVLRFGSVDLKFVESEAEGAAMPLVAALASPDSGTMSLKPLSDEVDVPDWLKGDSDKSPPAPKAESKTRSAEDSSKAASRPKVAKIIPETPKATSGASEKAKADKPRGEKPAAKSKAPRPPVDDDDDFGEFDLDAGLEALAQESRASHPVMPTFDEPSADTADYDRPVRSKSRPATAPASTPKSETPAELASPAAEGPPPAPAAPPKVDRVRDALRHQRRARPGEEDVLRSPLVIGLGSAAVVSLILAAIFYFVGFRRSVQEEFDFAKAQFNENKFTQAIEAFNLFLAKHGEGSLAEEANRIRGLAMVDEQITGAAPRFSEGMKNLKDFIAEHRDAEGYSDNAQRDVAKRAGDIALGASKAAGRVFDSALLDVARDAKSSLVTASSKETPPTELLKEIDRNLQVSAAAILKHNTNNEQYKQIEAAIAANKPLEALRLRRELLARYPDLETDKKIASITASTLEKERSLIREEALDRPALTDRLVEPQSLTLVYQARTRTDQVSVSRAIPVVSHGTLFGIDTVTGGPVWKHSVGVDTPFFPVRDSASNSLIAFNSPRQEVMRIDQNSGAILWRQPIEERASGRPLISEGQVFIPTVAGRLCRLELESGTLVSRLSFSQPISNPVAVETKDKGVRIIVSGDREVFYTLSARPFACTSVSYLGQPSQSIVAPLLALGPYVLACQNLSNDASRLRLITTEPTDQPLKEVASHEVAGQVLDAPVVRGRDLFVPSTNERVAAFQISDEMSQAPLVPGPKYEVKGAQPVVTQLSAAPDAQLFMASTAVRKLELKVDSLQPTQEAILLGKATQPLQFQDRLLFVARQRPFAESVVLTPIDRTSLTGEWQAITGARIIAASVAGGDNPSVVCVTESGQLFRVTPRSLEGGGFLSVAERLPLNEELVDPLLATTLGEGQLAIAGGLPEPKLWIVNRLGQIERTATLASPLQAAPVAMGKAILAPVNGRLQLLQAQGGQAAAQEYRLPGDLSGPTKWVQVFAADADSAAGVLENGIVLGVRLQKSPQAHLIESARYSLEAPLVSKPHFGGGMLAVAGANGRVAVLAAENLEPRGEAAFAGPIASGPWLAGEFVFVEPGDGTLQARSIARDLPAAWSLPLQNDRVAGAPIVRGADLLIPLQSGRLVRCDLASGEVRGATDLHAVLAGSPLVIGNGIYLTTLDGSLIRVPEEIQ